IRTHQKHLIPVRPERTENRVRSVRNAFLIQMYVSQRQAQILLWAECSHRLPARVILADQAEPPAKESIQQNRSASRQLHSGLRNHFPDQRRFEILAVEIEKEAGLIA